MSYSNFYFFLMAMICLGCQNTGERGKSLSDLRRKVDAVDVRKGPDLTLTSTTAYQNILAEECKTDWSGSPEHWRWENGVLTGETTDDNPIDQNSFLIWNRDVEDFILTISFRISSQGNSGIYYRCETGPEGYDSLLGYQADIDGQHTYTGIVYENFLNRHHKILAPRTKLVRISDVDSVQVFSLYPMDLSLKDLIQDGDWNNYELIVKGNLIVQKLNGHLISVVEDDFPDRLRKGKFGFQLHKGPPMKVEFKNGRFLDLIGRIM